MSEEDVLVSRGRFQPFGNQHAAYIDHFARAYDADRVVVVVPAVAARSPKNPFTGEEVLEMVYAAYREDYDVDYAVEPVLQTTFLDADVVDAIGDEPTFFTREKLWSRIVNAGVGQLPGVPDLDAVYEPRDDEPYDRMKEQGFPVEESSTNIRQRMVNGEEWRDYVAPSVAARIEGYGEAWDALKAEDEQNLWDRKRKYADQVRAWLG